MRKIRSLVVTLLLAASFLLPAFADGWYCPSCGRYNDNNFCPKDGTKKPADLGISINSKLAIEQQRVLESVFDVICSKYGEAETK